MRLSYPAALLLTLFTAPVVHADALPAEECLPASCSVPSAQIGNDQIDLVCIRYDFPVPGQSSWFYTVQSGHRPAISHVVFSLNLSCVEVVESGTWDASPDDRSPGQGMPEVLVNVDPTTGVGGLKFDQGFDDGEVRNYYFVLSGNVQVSPFFSVASKGGNGFDTGSLCGPSADCSLIDECAGACEAPLELSAVAVSAQSAFRDADPGNFLTAAEVSWLANPCAMGWRVCAQNQGTGERVCQVTTTNQVTFDQLVPGTSYLFAARTRCLDGSKSPWSTALSFLAPQARLEATEASGWTIFPNPASTQFRVNWDPGAASMELRLHDVTGALRASYKLNTSGKAGQQTIATDHLAEGWYVLTIIRDGATETRQVRIQH